MGVYSKHLPDWEEGGVGVGGSRAAATQTYGCYRGREGTEQTEAAAADKPGHHQSTVPFFSYLSLLLFFKIVTTRHPLPH